ncbi:unnamed protein product [Hermetia illucens]|uniref:Uncharacterized protein n=1 Tax=Hermetia illucens TaxID=343691 RepID=A0A7R8YNP4_HERIL|nr:ribonuclease Oy [Hermetia illucens]CAD7079788.1 unnamed protein product [Hermetia illucens]
MTRSPGLLCLSYFLIAAAAITVVSCSDADYYDQDLQDHEWDVLIFTQQWPVTACFHWIEENHKHSCSLPNKKEFWTIHGIWPTKYGTVGPSFCNKSAEFDMKQIEPIEDALKEFWPSVEADFAIQHLWEHEWLKHGTCAASLVELDNERRYFEQGLNWRDKYLVSNMLGAAGIHPDSSNTVIALQNALKKTLEKNPSIHCVYDHETQTSYLAEIRICFNKTLGLIDCDGVPGSHIAIDYPGGKVITNCHISKPVQYPSVVPPIPPKSWKFPFVNLYKLLNFVMWFTL